MSKITQLKKKKLKKDLTPKERLFNIPEHELVINILCGDLNWDQISNRNLSLEFVTEYKDYLNWTIISRKSYPSIYYKLFIDKLDWKVICSHKKLDPKFIKKYSKYMVWDCITIYGCITDDIFIEYFEELYCSKNFNSIFENPNCTVSCDVFDKYTSYFENTTWKKISSYQHITFEFVDKYINNLHWGKLCYNLTFNQDQIIKYKKYIKWNKLSSRSIMNCSTDYQKEILSHITDSSIIIRLIESGYVNSSALESITDPNIWKSISYNAAVSETFIIKYKNKISKNGIRKNIYVSNKTMHNLKEMGII